MSEYEQLQLDLGKQKSIDPWKLSRRQFESSPEIVWRAESSESLGSHFDPYQSGGIHFGSKEAALDRGAKVAAVRAAGHNLRPPVEEGQPVRLFSARVKGRFGNKPDTPGKDIGKYWPIRSRGHWYKNKVENYNSISGYVPQREGFLETHRESVLNAIQAGKDVHPNIRWEAEHSPEWSDTVQPEEKWKRSETGPLFPGTIHAGRVQVLLNMYEEEALRKGGLRGLSDYQDQYSD